VPAGGRLGLVVSHQGLAFFRYHKNVVWNLCFLKAAHQPGRNQCLARLKIIASWASAKMVPTSFGPAKRMPKNVELSLANPRLNRTRAASVFFHFYSVPGAARLGLSVG